MKHLDYVRLTVELAAELTMFAALFWMTWRIISGLSAALHHFSLWSL